MAAGALAGCGNRAEGDGKVPAAVADAGNTGSLGGETPAPAETAAPTVEPGAAVTPASAVTVAPAAAATPATEETAAPTAEPGAAVTAAPAVTATPVPAVTVAPTVEPAATATPAPAVTVAPAATPAPAVTVAPTAEPTPASRVTAAPTAKPVPAVAPAPTAEPAPAVTPAPTAAPGPAMTGQQAGNTGNQSDAGTGPETGSTSQGGEQTANQNNGDGGAVSSLQASAELHNSEFIALLNADRVALGLNSVSDNGVLNANALASAEAVASNYSHEAVVRGDANRENIGYVFENNVESIYEAWKDSEGHWNAMIDPYLEYCSVARYNGFWVFLGYAGNPILDMTTQEAVEQGLLEQINTAENGSEFYASPGSDAHVETEEERKEAEALGWDW